MHTTPHIIAVALPVLFMALPTVAQEEKPPVATTVTIELQDPPEDELGGEALQMLQGLGYVGAGGQRKQAQEKFESFLTLKIQDMKAVLALDERSTKLLEVVSKRVLATYMEDWDKKNDGQFRGRAVNFFVDASASSEAEAVLANDKTWKATVNRVLTEDQRARYASVLAERKQRALRATKAFLVAQFTRKLFPLARATHSVREGHRGTVAERDGSGWLRSAVCAARIPCAPHLEEALFRHSERIADGALGSSSHGGARAGSVPERCRRIR